MTAVAVGCSAWFGRFSPSVPLSLMAPYTGDSVTGLNHILRPIRALEPQGVLRTRTANPMDSGTDGADRSVTRDGEPEPGQSWRGPPPSVQPMLTKISSVQVRHRVRCAVVYPSLRSRRAAEELEDRYRNRTEHHGGAVAPSSPSTSEDCRTLPDEPRFRLAGLLLRRRPASRSRWLHRLVRLRGESPLSSHAQADW